LTIPPRLPKLKPMPTPRVLVLRSPGTNCDEETAYAFEVAGAAPQRLHINQLLESPDQLSQFQVLCIPGGFSYGDDIAAGRILGNQIRYHLRDWIGQFVDAQKLVLGVCNGFQVLLKSGLLVADSSEGDPRATLAWNRSGKYQDLWVELKVTNNNCAFLAGLDSLYLPVAHAEGRFVARDEATLDELDQAGQLPLRYAVGGRTDARELLPAPHNPNGAMGNVAGVCDPSGRVLGLMPHPERYIHPTQHPHWTRLKAAGTLPEVGDGLAVFQNAVRYFA